MSADLVKLPAELRKQVAKETAPGERVLYAGRPDWRAERGMLITLFLFGVFWSAISMLFFGFSAASLLGVAPMLSDGKPVGLGMQLFFFFFSLPFVAIGAVVLVLPFLAIRKANNTAHVITDARVLSVSIGKDAGVDSYKFAAINYVTRRDRRNGTGSLTIGYGVARDSDGDTRPLTLDWSGIPDAKRAEAILRDSAMLPR
ncbi:MAG: hypothetical protein ACT4OU_09295 [Hyphomicrobium sp.]